MRPHALAGLVGLALAAIAAPARAAPQPGVVAGYDPEIGTFVRTADGRWELNPYAMVQVTHIATGHGSDLDSNGFNLHAAKLIFHGHAFLPTLSYHLQLNAGEGRVAAEDVYLQWRATSWFSVLVGQYEVPFNRQHITLEAYQELVERSLVDARFNLQRDIGIIGYFSDPARRYEATVGLFNGSRQNLANDESGYLTTLRLAYNPMGPIAFREADIDDTHRPKLSVAVAGAFNPERVVPGATSNAPSTSLRQIAQGAFEVTLRFRGVSLSTELHARRQVESGSTAVSSAGGFEQIGYFIVPSRLQLVGRFARVTGPVAKLEGVGEETVGLGYYFMGHRLKLQADGSHLETRTVRTGWRIRTQLEFFL